MNHQSANYPPHFLVPADLLAFKEDREKSVSDKLSETLARHTVVLEDEIKHREWALRQQLLEAAVNFDDCRETEGRIFFEYCEIYKGQRLWTKVGTAIGLRFGYSLRTVERIRDEHKRKLGIKPARRRLLKEPVDQAVDDLATEVLSRQKDELLVARYHLREAVVPFSGARIIEVLTHLIGAECFSSWGIDKEFTMRIVPGPTNVMITSENGVPQDVVDEENAASPRPSQILIKESSYGENAPDTTPDQSPIWLVPERGTTLAVPIN